MPKLNQTKAAAVEEAGGGDFEALEEDIYVLKLCECKVAEKEGPSGPYWIWEFEIPEDYENAGRRFWMNTSLSEKALWKLNETFSAFGVPADTDTDELVGSLVQGYVTQVVQQKGKNAGKLVNQLETLSPFEGDGEAEGGDEDF